MRTQDIRSRSNPPVLRKRLKAEERRSQLLRIAKKLFSERGFENTTTKAIASGSRCNRSNNFQALCIQGGTLCKHP